MRIYHFLRRKSTAKTKETQQRKRSKGNETKAGLLPCLFLPVYFYP
nr:MAG TPA: hypothetical protein [Caudoviricetes sp.]